jgi:molybdopterin synthase sulfur carrier subunit
MLKVLLFAGMREALGTSMESVLVPTPPTVAGLVDALRARGENWSEALAAGKRWRVAVNQDMASLESPVKAGDEVAIFPPVTGG